MEYFSKKKKKKEWNECIIKEGKEKEPFFFNNLIVGGMGFE